MKNIKKERYTTGDGSPTLYLPALNEYYHSHHGAVQEANYVYIKNGLYFHGGLTGSMESITVFEVGLGTGLNAFLTAQEAQKQKKKIIYVTIEPYPLPLDEILELSFPMIQTEEDKELWNKIHTSSWEKENALTPWFTMHKEKCLLEDFVPSTSFDVLYYDAFGARAQPEMWEDHCFEQLVPHLNPNGVLSTYSSKGSVRRILHQMGLEVERIAGTPGKRQMIRERRPKM